MTTLDASPATPVAQNGPRLDGPRERRTFIEALLVVLGVIVIAGGLSGSCWLLFETLDQARSFGSFRTPSMASIIVAPVIMGVASLVQGALLIAAAYALRYLRTLTNAYRTIWE